MSIISQLDRSKKKIYDYSYLDNVYYDFFSKDIDDSKDIMELKRDLRDKEILLVGPGKNAVLEEEKVQDYIESVKPIIIMVNWENKLYVPNYVFYSNAKRYIRHIQNENIKVIKTSNIGTSDNIINEYTINWSDYVRNDGCRFFDTSIIIVLRFLISIGVKKISLAGIDGYSVDTNYADSMLELDFSESLSKEANENIRRMLTQIKNEMPVDVSIEFITTSMFADIYGMP
jgi:4-hydroxy 2-oxovalerate aldolase